MKIIVLGAGHIGRALVEALHEEHELTVIDIDADRLAALADRYDVRTVQGDGTTAQGRPQGRRRGRRPVHRLQPARGGQPRLRDARQAAVGREDDRAHDQHRAPRGLARARDRRRLHDLARARDRERDRGHRRPAGRAPDRRLRRRQGADRRVRRARRRPARRPDRAPAAQRRDAGQTPRWRRSSAASAWSSRAATSRSCPATASWSSPRRSPPARGAQHRAAQGASASTTSSSSAPGRWGRRSRACCSSAASACGSSTPTASARARSPRGCPACARSTPTPFDPDFLERQRIGRATAAVFCPQRRRAQPLQRGARQAPRRAPDDRAGARRGRRSRSTSAAAWTSPSTRAQVTAEEMVRFAHDPRIRQIAMLEQRPLRDPRHRPCAPTPSSSTSRSPSCPATGSVIGAVIRDDDVLLPAQVRPLRAGDRVIIFVESRRASLVEKAL